MMDFRELQARAEKKGYQLYTQKDSGDAVLKKEGFYGLYATSQQLMRTLQEEKIIEPPQSRFD